MKRILSIILVCLFLMICAGCEADSSADIAVLTYRLDQAEATIETLEKRIVALEEAAQAQEQQVVNEDTAASENESPAQVQNAPVPATAEALLVERLKEYKGTAAFIKYAFDENVMNLQFATEYRLGDLGGHKIHILIASVEVDRDIYGVDVGNIVIDMENGELYHSNRLDLENIDWDDLSSKEDAYAAILAAYGSWRYFEMSEPYICTDSEYREDFTADQLQQINAMLN